ncbi:MAG TPA: hypothetical protein PLD47_18050 [Aggregatilineales bacterium]|nr:hypothetical protein [Anaerolineales bacterium]HRE49632.1 hypothetical protein [Aggregatilineales bacterium]
MDGFGGLNEMKRTSERCTIFFLISLIALIALSPIGEVRAEDGESGQAQAALALVVAHPAFSDFLANEKGWGSGVYHVGGRLDIWRVDLWGADEESLGWAHVSLKMEKVYSYEAYYRLSETAWKAGEAAVSQFVLTNPEIAVLLGGNPKADNLWWFDYQAYQNRWIAYFGFDGESYSAEVVFKDASRFTFTTPALMGIGFPDVISYTEWRKQQTNAALAIAFGDVALAAHVRAVAGWKGEGEPDGEAWKVVFKDGERVLATVWVDLTLRTVIRRELR